MRRAQPWFACLFLGCDAAWPEPYFSVTAVASVQTATNTNAVRLRQPELGGGAVLAQLAGWKWQDVMQNMDALRDAGFTGLLLSPHTATCSGAFGGAGYDPSDFRSFTSGFGTESDLWWLIQSAHDHGLDVYADMVLNHMCAKGDYAYDRFGWDAFHHNGSLGDATDEWSLENDDLLGLHDLAQESDYVRGELWNFLVKTNDFGFDGYRWDATKHVPRWYWRDHVVNNVNAWGKFSFGEVFSGDLSALESYATLGMSVTDYALYFAIRDAFRVGGDLARLDRAGFAGINPERALTFVENHDVQAPPNRLLAYAFLAAYPGYPCFGNVQLWDGAINNLAWIHSHKAKGDYISRHSSRDTLFFERQGNLLAGINQSGEWFHGWIETSWQNQRLHDYSGHSSDVWTDGNRWVEVAVPPGAYVMYAP